MTYYSRYRDIQFTAISEVGLTGGSGESFSVGDSFTYSGADATINVRDNDSFLAGDSYRNERGNDYQAGTIETENGTINAGNVYAESFYILYGSDGRVYFLAEIEGTGLSNDLSQDDYFTFIGHVPPAGVELTAVAQKNVFGGIRYSSLGAGDIADAGIPGQAVDDEFTVSEESDGTSITFNLLDNDVLGSASSLEVTAVDGMAVGGGTAIDLADGGSVLVGGDGSVQFDADGDFEALGAGETQIVSFNYAVTDSDGNTSAATAFITVTGSNDGPTLAAGNIDVVEGGVTISLDLAALGNDIDNDDDGTTLTYSISGQPSEGVASISGTTLNFDPINDFQDLADGETRDVILQITATDRHGATATNDVTVTVTGTNDAPTVNSPVNFGSIPEDGLIVIEQGELIDGSSDVDGDALSVTNVTSSDGTLTDDGFGGVIFNAAPNFNGLATIDVEISDGIETVIRQITVNVIPQNDAPTVNGPLDLGAIDEDTSRTITVSELVGNVTDVDGDALRLNSVTSTSGTVTSDGSGNFIFSPEANDDTEVTITYVVSDGIASVTGTATLDLTAVNDDPVVASALMATATEDDEVFSVDLLDGASDVDTGDVLSISNLVVLSGDASGVTLNGTNLDVDPSAYNSLAVGQTEIIEYRYDIEDGNNGSVSQTATITITGTNDNPTLAAGMLDAQEDGGAVSLNLSMLGDDPDSEDDGISLVYSIGMQPLEQGSFSLDGTTLTFDPGADFQNLSADETRDVEIEITATDAQNATAMSRVTVTVTGMNDAPFIPEGQSLDLGAVTEGTTTAFSDLSVFDVDGPDQVEISSITANRGQVVQTIGLDFEFSAPDVGPAGELVTITIGYTDGATTTFVDRTVFVTELAEPQDVAPTAGYGFINQTKVFNIVDPDLPSIDTAGVTFSATTADGEPLPDWLVFDPTMLTLTGTPDGSDAGLINIIVTATDAGGQQTSSQFPIVVLNGTTGDGVSTGSLSGTQFGDLLLGGISDNISGNGGDDFIVGSSTGVNDLITLSGGDGNDVIVVETGRASIRDGDGDDFVFATEGSNHIFRVGAGQNVILAGAGNDVFNTSFQSTGDNQLFGGEGNDLFDILPTTGNFEIDAGAGNDIFEFSQSATGDFVITLGEGRDRIEGKVDRFSFDGIEERIVTDFRTGVDGDLINFDFVLFNIPNFDGASNPYPQFVRLEQDGNDTLFQIDSNRGEGVPNFVTWLRLESTSVGDFVSENFQPAYDPQGGAVPAGETIIGTNGQDLILGGLTFSPDGDNNSGVGDDFIDAQGGSDEIFGDAGNDTIFGGSGNDNLRGGLGNDVIAGGADNDFLSGGPGNDRLEGNSGDDFLVGGPGSDTFVFAQGGDITTIFDFEDGVDVVELQQFGLDANEVDAVIADVPISSINPQLDFGNGDILIFESFDVSILSSDDFILN